MSKWKKYLILLAVGYGQELPIELVREAMGI